MKTVIGALIIGVMLVTTAHAEPIIKGLPDFTPLVEKYGPAVVNIHITIDPDKYKAHQNEEADESPATPAPPCTCTPPLPPPVKRIPTQGTGSGFLISSNGYILTNAHVVNEAKDVTVRLTDQREFPAKIIGIDERTDVAVIKIEATNLPILRLGHSSSVRPGQWVVAIGSPFGFESTVTAGIVSAISRSSDNDNGFVPFIQSDVVINPGNSGGPLFNLNGDVIGINSQIYSRSGAFEGISFSIPIDIAIDVEQQLIATGHVVRGRVGIAIQAVDQDIATSVGLDRPHGAYIVSVDRTGPAGLGGVREGDIILSINDNPIEHSNQLPIIVSNLKPNVVAKLEVWRNKKIIILFVTISMAKEG